MRGLFVRVLAASLVALHLGSGAAMAEQVQPIPENYKSSIPYLNVDQGVRAVEFYKKGFGARELVRVMTKTGKLAHSELRIGDAIIMVRDAIPELKFLSPSSVGGTPLEILIFVKDVDSFTRRAEAAGAKVIAPPTLQFHGDRLVIVEDPFGHWWFFASRVEDIPLNELQERAREWGI